MGLDALLIRLLGGTGSESFFFFFCLDIPHSCSSRVESIGEREESWERAEGKVDDEFFRIADNKGQGKG